MTETLPAARPAQKSAMKLYADMEAARSPYLRRARQVAELTLPHLMPPDGYSGQDLPTPYQGTGSRGISSLSSKLLLALFPPSQSFMRLELDPAHDQRVGPGQVRSEIDESLARIERAAQSSIEQGGLRPHLHEVLKQLVVAGNVLLHLKDDGTKVHRLDSYVCKRAPTGKLLLLIVKESAPKLMLPDDALAVCQTTVGGESGKEEVDIYTVVRLTREGKYDVWQEIAETPIESTKGSFKVDELPFIALRMDPVGDYGYGYACGLLGDLASLEGLMKALVEASAASARLVFLVNPTSATRVETLNKAPNGSFVTGMPDDVVALKVDKAADMAVAFNAIGGLQKSLGYAFLLNQSVQRSGERVTAEEIRTLTQELEDVLAGTYALLAQELQLPIVKVYLARLAKKGTTPKLEGVAAPVIVTGLEALGRGHDLGKLDMFVQGATNVFGPEITAKYLHVGDYFTRRATALGLNTDGLVKTAEEIQQAEAAAQQQQLVQTVAPETVRQVGAAVQAANQEK